MKQHYSNCFIFELQNFTKKWKDRPIANWAMVRNQIAMNSEMQARITKYENI